MPGNKRPKKKFKNTVCKLKTNSPINIRYDKAGDLRLKLPPQISLEQFKNNEGTLAAWTTLYFRIHVGLKLADKFSNESIPIVFNEAIEILNINKNNYAVNKVWNFTGKDIDAIRSVLTTIDELQDNTTRRDQLEAYNSVYKNVPAAI
jgi:hypothetical protein